MTEPCDVLVVDDEAVVRDVVVRVLQAAGFRIAVAADGSAALAHPAADTARMVLLDVMLPDQSGLDVMLALRLRRPRLPFVLMTGYTLSPALASGESLGIPILAKPFDDDELLAAVGSVLGLVPKEASS